jgi:tyrosyl-tRNA synthetase
MEDADVGRFLRWFTFLDEPAIKELEKQVGSGARVAQKALAQEVTTLVHGKAEMENAIRASEALFSGDIGSLPVALLKQVAADVPSITVARAELGSGLPLIDLLVKAQACKSKGEARRLISQKGVRVNGKQPGDENPTAKISDFLDGEVLLLQKGKRDNYLVLLAKA